jgi:quercetin dioxygenase-like cupin family protein
LEHSEAETGAEKLIGRSVKAIGLIDYQESSVVSRTIIDENGGTVTLFAFDRGQGLSEHTAPYDALVLILDGEAEATVSGQPIHLREGEMTLMPANAPHSMKATTRFKMMLTMISS